MAAARGGLRRIGATLDEWFAPPCVGCALRAPGVGICAGCARALPWNLGACARCANPMPAGARACLSCVRRPPPWEAARCPFVYDFPVDRMIHEFKFGRRIGTGRVLARLAADWIASHGARRPEMLIAVPLHWQRRLARHFNPAHEIAHVLSRRLRVPLAAPLRRSRATTPQSSLSAARRRRNLRGAFRLVRPVRARHVALVDDVVTTGATAAEITAVLRAGGVAVIELWALARADLNAGLR